MAASIKVVNGPLRTPSDVGLHTPILSENKGASKALAASVAVIVAMGYTEEQAKKMVGAQ